MAEKSAGVVSDMVFCKSCGKEIAKSAKSCPNCGAENNPPIYKRPVFIVIVLLIIPLLCCCSTVGFFSLASPSPADKQSSIDECIEVAYEEYAISWDEKCVLLGMPKDCRLPGDEFDVVEDRYNRAKELCIERYK